MLYKFALLKSVQYKQEALLYFPRPDVQKWLTETRTIIFNNDICDDKFWGKGDFDYQEKSSCSFRHIWPMSFSIKGEKPQI